MFVPKVCQAGVYDTEGCGWVFMQNMYGQYDESLVAFNCFFIITYWTVKSLYVRQAARSLEEPPYSS